MLHGEARQCLLEDGDVCFIVAGDGTGDAGWWPGICRALVLIRNGLQSIVGDVHIVRLSLELRHRIEIVVRQLVVRFVLHAGEQGTLLCILCDLQYYLPIVN